MLFIVFAAVVAFSLAAVSGAFSIIGMASTFPSIFWSVLAMGVVLEAGKLTAASFLYRYWNNTSKFLSIPMLVFVAILTTISITGHFGYLSKGYMQDSLPQKQVTIQIEQLEKERDRKIERKHEIDAQIAQLPSDRAASRVKLAKQFSDEQESVTTRINELDTKITDLKSKELDATSHIGPIAYIASAFGISTDEGVKWFILIIASVFDPLALALTISISVMLRVRQEKIDAEKEKPEEEIVQPKIKKKKKQEDAPLDLFELTEENEMQVQPKKNDRDLHVTTPYNIK